MTSSEDAFISKLKSLIDANVDDPAFSVDTVCRDMAISRAQLHRIVKEEFDLSVTLYIRKVRLEKANYLLANSNLRISEVADRVGISNPQNFSKYFTQEFAITPTEFRRLHQAPATALPMPEAVLPTMAPLPSGLALPEGGPSQHPKHAAPQRLSRPTTPLGSVWCRTRSTGAGPKPLPAGVPSASYPACRCDDHFAGYFTLRQHGYARHGPGLRGTDGRDSYGSLPGRASAGDGPVVVGSVPKHQKGHRTDQRRPRSQ